MDRWPKNIKLKIYHEDNLNVGAAGNVEFKHLFLQEPGCKAFVDRHKNRQISKIL